MGKHGFIAPLSYQQRELWIAEQFKTRTNTYVISTSYKIEGDLCVSFLEKSINKIIQRHEILRAVFMKKNGSPILFIEDEKVISVDFKDVSGLVNWGDYDKINEILFSQEEIPMSLTEGPLLRVTLFKIANESFLMLIEIHHLICDGWSLSIFIKELFHFYNQEITGEKKTLPLLTIQYPDYTTWENQYLEKNNFDDNLTYWKNKLQNAPRNIELPADYHSSLYQTNEGSVAFFEFPLELSKKIKKLSRVKEVSLFTMLFSGFGILLSRYSQQDDMLIGTTIANRKQPELENLIGFFVDFVALRLKYEKEKKFTDFLLEMKKNILEGFSNNQLPFSKVVDELNLQKDSSLNSFFQVMFIFQNTPIVESSIHNLKIAPYKNNNLTAKYDITVEMRESNEQILGLFQYNTRMFEEKTIKKMIDAFIEIFESITDNKDLLLSEINCITTQELNELKYSKNDTKVHLEDSPSLIDLFEKIVKKEGAREAVIFEDNSLTYNELNEISDRFSNFLKTKLNVNYGDRVAIKMKRSEQLIIAVLGILKLGAAYVPLDLDYPELVLNEMINDSAVKTVIDDAIFENFYSQRMIFSLDKNGINRNEDNIIALLYTTGSTGKSKGVIIKNSNLYNRLNWMWSEFPFQDNEVCVAKTSFSFVDHMWELFGPLLKGIKVVVFDRPNVVNIHEFISKLDYHKITRIVLVPSLLREILMNEDLCTKKLTHLKEWTSSGEVLNAFLVEKFYNIFPNSRLLNIYGSTEVTADATYYDTSIDKKNKRTKIPIGKPIYNTKVFIIDGSNNLLPVGAIGEICISGLGVTDGYFRNNFLNESKFFVSSFLDGELLYKTGDFGKWLLDGNIDYIGRKDNQVKIMGNRIDLVEVKTHLIKLPNIEDAIIISNEGENGNNVLIAFLLGSEKLNVDQLRADLSKRIKNYMLPSIFIQLEKFPLTPNGKVDEKLLKNSDLITKKPEQTFLSPTNEIEEQLVSLWSDILDIPYDKIGILDNFFELGGNSIKLLSLVTKLKLNFHKDIAITDIFKYVNIKSQSLFLADQEEQQIRTDREIESSRDLLIDTIDKFLN